MPLFPDSPLRLRIRGSIGARPLDGVASLAVSADALLLVPADDPAGDDGVLRIPLDRLDGVTQTGDDGGTITLHLGGAGRLTGSGDARVGLLAATILREGRAMPELTRAARALGGRHGSREQARFFRPLLEARRAAVLGGDDAIAAFDPRALRRAVEHVLARIAAERHPVPGPAQRALEARLADAAEPLFTALSALDAAAEQAGAADDATALRRWRAWLGLARNLFDRADSAWRAVDELLRVPPPSSVPPAPLDLIRRWTT